MTATPPIPAPPPAGEATPRRPRTLPPLELLVFVVGSASLGAEIAAARLLAPYFGASTIVWANTIATVLVALSAGYWLGGRMADRRPDLPSLCGLVMIAAVLLATVPLVSDPFLGLSVEAFDSLSVGAFFGSLFGVLSLVAVPVLLLGAASPWAIRLKIARVEDAGKVSGRMYAISTFGSLVGTFLSALLLIPLVGTQRTFILFALALALIAAVGLRPRMALVPVAVAAALAIPVGVVKGAEGPRRVIFETETPYQYVRVTENEDGERRLELNEGQAVHSLYRPGSVLTDNVWDGYLVAPFAALADPPRKLAILGNGAGTTARAYERFFPATRIDGVEIDGELTEIGERFFGLRPRPQLRTFDQDARPFLRRSGGGYDAIFVDAYRQPYIPFYLATREFFELARDRLTPGGVVVLNAGHPEGSTLLEEVLAATMADVFGTVLAWPIEENNTLLIAADGDISRARLRASIPRLPAELVPLADRAARELRAPVPGGEVYTDDRAPVEWLIDRSIIEYAAGEGG